MTEPQKPAGISPSLERWTALELEHRALAEKLDAIEAEQDKLEPGILEDLAQAGVESVRISGLTVYPRRELYAGVEKPEGVDERQAIAAACAALEAVGLGDLVETKPSSQRLSAYVRELERAGEPLPPELAGSIRVSERVSLRARKSK